MPPRSKKEKIPDYPPWPDYIYVPEWVMHINRPLAPETEAPAPPKKIPRTPERRAEEIPPTPPPSPQPCSLAEKIPESRPESSMLQGSSSLAALQKRFKKDCQQAGVIVIGPAIPESTPGSAGGTSSGTARIGDTRCEERPQEALEDIQAEETCTTSRSHSWKDWKGKGMHQCDKCHSWNRARDAVLFGSFEENGEFICMKCSPAQMHLDRSNFVYQPRNVDVEKKEKERCS